MSTPVQESATIPKSAIRIMPWMKLSLRTRIDPVVALLSFDDQRHLVWLMMMEMEGVMDAEYGSNAIRDKVIAKALGLTVEAAAEVHVRLSELMLINSLWKTCGQVVDNKSGDIGDASQGASHASLAERHTTSADRTRKYRANAKAAKLKALGINTSECDVSVTSQCVAGDALEREGDKELNKPSALTTEAVSVDKSEKQPDSGFNSRDVSQEQIDTIVNKFTQFGYPAKMIISADSIGMFTDWIRLGITRRRVDQAIDSMHTGGKDLHVNPVIYVDAELRAAVKSVAAA